MIKPVHCAVLASIQNNSRFVDPNKLFNNSLTSRVSIILAVKLKMINQDRMIFGDFSVNFKPISLKFFRGYFLLKSQQG